MTDAYASAVTVSIPIFVLAAGAEARAIRERLKRPDEKWEQAYASYRAEHDLDSAGRPADVVAHLRGVPGVARFYLAERLLAVGGALVWLAVFVLLAIAEVRSLVWLGDGSPPGNASLATFALVSITAAMVALIIAPAAYLLVPLTLPLDLIPKGLKDEVKAKLGPEKGRSFVRLTLGELEGALERAAGQLESEDGPTGQPAPPAQPDHPPEAG
ncbi:MAG TPA: hypothetical protein VGI74_09655 [Streptosporangiaceae bacterium]